MPILDNPRYEAFARAIAGGCRQDRAAIAAGYSARRAKQQGSWLMERKEVLLRVREIQQELLEAQLVTARELHQTWSEMWRADITDIVDVKTGAYKPIHEWPVVWRRMIRDVDVKDIFARSTDGQASESYSWDKVGQIVKIRFLEMTRLGEMLARHKAVDAFVAQKTEADMELTVRAEQITTRLELGRKKVAEARCLAEKAQKGSGTH